MTHPQVTPPTNQPASAAQLAQLASQYAAQAAQYAAAAAQCAAQAAQASYCQPGVNPTNMPVPPLPPQPGDVPPPNPYTWFI